jgi:hypothetical protein
MPVNSVEPLQTVPVRSMHKADKGILLFGTHTCSCVPVWCVPLLLANGKLHAGHAGIHELAGCHPAPRVFR